jgi:hypothetical protein
MANHVTRAKAAEIEARPLYHRVAALRSHALIFLEHIFTTPPAELEEQAKIYSHGIKLKMQSLALLLPRNVAISAKVDVNRDSGDDEPSEDPIAISRILERSLPKAALKKLAGLSDAVEKTKSGGSREE